MENRLIPPERLQDYGITINERQRRRLEQAGQFPKRVHPTARTHAYVMAEIEAYVADCIAARDTAPEAA